MIPKSFAAVVIVATVCYGVASGQSNAEQKPAITAASSAEEEFSAATKAYFELGSKDALPKLQHALESLRAVGDQKLEAQALGFIGNCYKHLGDYKSALDYLIRAVELARKIHDRLQEGKTLNHLGLLAWEMADYPKAIAEFTQSLSVAHEVGNKQLEASVSNNLGLVYDEQGDYEHSLPQYEMAIAIDREIKFERGEAEATANVGGVYLSLGQFREAQLKYEQALALAKQQGLKPLAGQASGNIGLCQSALGNYSASVASFDQAIQLAREAGQAKEEADWRKGKGSVFKSLGKFDAARTEYSVAIESYEKGSLKRELVEALSDRGQLYLGLGDIEKASSDFTRATQIAREIGYTRGLTENLAQAGRIEVHQGQPQRAEQLYRESLERARAGKQLDAQAGVLILLSELLRQTGNPADGVTASKQAIELAISSASPLTTADAQYTLGEALLSLQRPQDALRSFEEAAPIAKQDGAVDLEWRIYYGQARALEAENHDSEAVYKYVEAINLVESVRSALAEERFRAGYFQDKAQVYVDLVRLLIRLGRVREAFAYSERLRSQSYRQLLTGQGSIVGGQKEIELRSRIRQLQLKLTSTTKQNSSGRSLNDEQLSQQLRSAEREYQDLLDDLRSQQSTKLAFGLETTTAEEIQKLVPSNAAVIEFVVGESTISEIVISAHNVWATTVSGQNLTSRIELLRELIRLRHGEDWLAPASALYKQLIAPAADARQFHGIRRLYIVPNGVLYYLPFSALATKNNNGQIRLLVQDYELAYLPTAAAMNREGATSGSGNLLALAPSFSDLAYNSKEIHSIERYFPTPNEILAGTSATKKSFESKAGDYRVIHLATHGYFNKFNPLFSGIELQPESGDNGRLEVHEILGLKLHSNLVALSACETGLSSGVFSELPAGDEFVGLTRAFLGAGSTAVLASLWSVNDSSTALLMEKFYRSQSSSDRITALAIAQRQMIASGSPYSQPYYWAPFVLNETGQQIKAVSRGKTRVDFRVSQTKGFSAAVN